MRPPAGEADPSLRRVQRDSAVIAVAAAALALLIQRGQPGGALGVLAGAALMGVSYTAIKGGVTALVQRAAAAGDGLRGGARLRTAGGLAPAQGHRALPGDRHRRLGRSGRAQGAPAGPVRRRVRAGSGDRGRSGPAGQRDSRAALLMRFTGGAPCDILDSLHGHPAGRSLAGSAGQGWSRAGMEKLEHPLWIVDAANRIFGPAVNALLGLFGFQAADPANPIPNYLVMVYLIVFGLDCAGARAAVAAERREPGQAADRVRGRGRRPLRHAARTSSGRRGRATCRWSGRSGPSSWCRTSSAWSRASWRPPAAST